MEQILTQCIIIASPIWGLSYWGYKKFAKRKISSGVNLLLGFGVFSSTLLGLYFGLGLGAALVGLVGGLQSIILIHKYKKQG